MEKILITGANGFVGSTLCNELRARHINFVPTVRTAVDLEQIEVGNIDASTSWKEALSGCSAVIHLAARVHVMKDQFADTFSTYHSLNCDATLNLARQSFVNGVKRFVYISSIKVNGERTTGDPFTASDTPAPLDPYAQSKWEAERALTELSRQTGLEVVIVRPPLIYGPGVGANFLNLMRLVLTGMPLPLGSVNNCRSMIAIENLVDFLICCTRHPFAAGQTFLVSDDEDVSTSDLVRKLAVAMDRKVFLFYMPEKLLIAGATLIGRTSTIERLLGSLKVDIDKTKSVLDWYPRVKLGDALDATAKHFLSHS